MRRIFCLDCGVDRPLHPEDKAIGFKQRRVCIVAKKPAGLHIKVNGEDQPELPTLKCDQCGKPIQDGQGAVAFTMWRGENEPGNWETEYQ